MNGFNLETVYDSKIAPLMARIISICKEHKLPMFATFLYASDGENFDYCTTNLPFKGEREIPDELASLEPTIRGRNRAPVLRMRVTKSDGSIEETVILP